jgi:hypothetical protein
MFPDQFVRVAIRRIRRQIKQLQHCAACSHKRLRLLCPMRRAAIDDEENRTIDPGDQALEETIRGGG